MQKKLGLFSLTALVTGNMVGSGVFLLPANLARIGSISIFAWFFTASGALFLALVFARMSLLVPRAGGPYAYARAGFGNFIGFQTALIYWVAVWVGNCGVALALVGYLRVFFPELARPEFGILVAIVMIWIFTFVNVKGVHVVGITQSVTTILKMIPLLLIGIVGWWYFHPTYITHAFNVSKQANFPAFSYAAALIFWAFVGLESATIPAGAVNNPKRDIPLATILGTVIAALVYIASSVAIMGILPASALANSASPFSLVAQTMFGVWGERAVTLGVVVACIGGLNGWILVQGQVAMAAADDNLFPKIFARRNKVGVPAWGTIITSLCMTIALLLTMRHDIVDQFQLLILIVATASLMAYFYSAVAQIVVCVRDHRLSLGSVTNMTVAFFAAVYSFWTLFGAGKDMVFYVTMLLFICGLLYIGVCRKIIKN